jgi:hypothetical protein
MDPPPPFISLIRPIILGILNRLEWIDFMELIACLKQEVN